jgi:hypothetical protein
MANTKPDTLASVPKHRVLLFGRKLFDLYGSQLSSTNNADIQVIDFPYDEDQYSNLQRLTDYTLVVTDYAPFQYDEDLYPEQQNVFDKLISEALQSGTTICFVHYNEDIPRGDKYSTKAAEIYAGDCAKLRRSQLGFRILDRLSIRPWKNDTPILDCTIQRGVFQPFLIKWGASHNCFVPDNDTHFDDIIVSYRNLPIGFTKELGRGRIIFLPFQRDFDREDDLLKGIYTLVDCLLTYIAKMQQPLPEHEGAPFFKDEEPLNKELQRIEKQLKNKKQELEPFAIAKQLLYLAEYRLENAVPNFIQEHLGIKTERHEQYVEDCWILNDSGKRLAICEVKSYVKGCKRGAIYSVYHHRDTNNLDKAFPAILFVNQHIQAASWVAKDLPINKDDYQVAAKENILVLRIEDLIRLWSAIRKGSITRDYLLALLTNSRGWLKVAASLKITPLP